MSKDNSVISEDTLVQSASDPIASNSPWIADSGGYTLSKGVLLLADPSGAGAEAIRTLRTHIIAQHVDDGRRGLAICAASSGCGCTFTAVNLAVSLSQIGMKTLLLDANLRTPSVQTYIRPPRDFEGLRQCLSSREGEFSNYVQEDVLPNLSVMYSGGTVLDAQELLARDSFKDMIDRCLRNFDITIVDSPPANRCADARRISTVIGYSLIVARRNKSFVSDISTLAAQLRDDRAHVVGTVMNEA